MLYIYAMQEGNSSGFRWSCDHLYELKETSKKIIKRKHHGKGPWTNKNFNNTSRF